MREIVYTNIGFPEDLHRRLKHQAVEERRPLAEIVRDAVAGYMSRPPLREALQGELLAAARGLEPAARLAQGAALHAAARTLFLAGLKAQGFTDAEAERQWRSRNARGS